MSSHQDPVDPELEDRIQRAERGGAGATDAFQRLIGAIRADRADRPAPDLLARIVAMGAPPASDAADGRRWWQSAGIAIANLVGRTSPGALAGVRSGAAAVEHLAFETDDLAVDVAMSATDGDRWLIEGVIEPIGDVADDPAGPSARLAAFDTGSDPRVIEAAIDDDGRFTIIRAGRPDRVVIEYDGRNVELQLDVESTGGH